MSNQLATIGSWSIEDIETMKHTLAAGTSDSQFQLFLRTAHASGLNPFLNHIYAIVYQGKMSLQIGIEGITYLAKQKEGFLGYDAQVVYEGEPFKATRNKDGVWEIEHEPDVFAPDDVPIRGAYAVAYRDGFKPYTVIMKFSEVEHFLKSPIPNQQTMWKKYTADMFKKHVLKRALKGQFGIDINEDDLVSSNSSIESYERKDITPAAYDAAKKQRNATQPGKQQHAPEPDPVDEDDATKLKRARAEMKKKFQQLGITSPEEMQEYIANNVNVKGDKPTLTELTGLLKIMDMHIAEKQAKQDDDDDLLGSIPE